MHFSKMHGLGNDFVVVDSVRNSIHLNSEKIKKLSNRNYGIGFDQLLVVEPSCDSEMDFHCRIYNADGTEVNQCGNGVRCVAKFVYIKKLVNKRDIKISTNTGCMQLSIGYDDRISVNMGEPLFDPILVPFNSSASEHQKFYILFLPNQVILCGIVSIGNPHCVILVKSVETAPVAKIGALLEYHHCFPERANISFMQIINRNNIRLRVYERGTGETKACGSAACAAVAVGIQQGLLYEFSEVNLPGGILLVSWNGPGHSLYMTGSASHVYDGYVSI